MLNQLLWLPIGLFSILWVELVRDFYHTLSHYWQPLYKLHSWHHRVFRPDLSVTSEEIYRKAHWYNDVPEATVMLLLSSLPYYLASRFDLPHAWIALLGSLYTFTFLLSAIARGMGVPHIDELTDVTHRQGEFETIPASWFVNRPYHWRHHFDNQNAYFCGTVTFVDKFLGTALSLKGKKIAVTGASGSLGKALLKYLQLQGARVIALTSSDREIAIEIDKKIIPIKTHTWQVGREAELRELLSGIDILILNHGINVHGDISESAIERSYEINAFSTWRMLELFLKTVKNNEDIARKEVWVNTSEAEVSPAVSPLYELSKRTIGDLITLRRLNSPCVIRKVICGPFKSNLNPIGVMSADWVAKQVVNLAKRDTRNIIVTINPLTYLLFPCKEFFVSTYFKLFASKSGSPITEGDRQN